MRGSGRVVVFYDGVCGFCNRLNHFILKRDRAGRMFFAPLQGPLAGTVLARHGHNAVDLESVYVVADLDTRQERVVCRSAAILYTLKQLSGGWRILGIVGRAVPRPIADFVYRAVARNRYRILGQFDACPVQPPEWRARFLDTPDATPPDATPDATPLDTRVRRA